jgi:hypothetical protein
MISTGLNSWFVHQSTLAILPADSHLVAKQEKLAKEVINFAFHTTKGSLIYRKNDMGPTALVPLRMKAHADFYRP